MRDGVNVNRSKTMLIHSFADSRILENSSEARQLGLAAGCLFPQRMKMHGLV